MKKVILITGSNKGIGFEIARQLLIKGNMVFISGRDKSRLEEAFKKLKSVSPDVESLLMDVSNQESIKNAVAGFSKYKLKLDVLINNAGILPGSDRSILLNDFSLTEKVIQTNCYGPINVARELLNLMNRPGRIINISSGGGSMTDDVGGWAPAYCVSKTMLNSITRQMAHELRSQSIAVNAVCPGWVKTDMGGAGAYRTVEQGAETPVWLSTEASQEITGKFFRDKKPIPW